MAYNGPGQPCTQHLSVSSMCACVTSRDILNQASQISKEITLVVKAICHRCQDTSTAQQLSLGAAVGLKAQSIPASVLADT